MICCLRWLHWELPVLAECTRDQWPRLAACHSVDVHVLLCILQRTVGSRVYAVYVVSYIEATRTWTVQSIETPIRQHPRCGGSFGYISASTLFQLPLSWMKDLALLVVDQPLTSTVNFELVPEFLLACASGPATQPVSQNGVYSQVRIYYGHWRILICYREPRSNVTWKYVPSIVYILIVRNYIDPQLSTTMYILRRYVTTTTNPSIPKFPRPETIPILGPIPAHTWVHFN